MLVAAFEPGELLAMKFRLPLFEERSNSLVAVLRQVTTNLLSDFVTERPGEFLFLTGKKRPLYRPNCQWRPVSNFLRQCLHFLFELRARNDLIDEADGKCSFRVNHVAGVEKLRGFRSSGELRQEIRPAIIGKESDFYKILTEGRFFRGNANIRGQSDVHASPAPAPIPPPNHALRHGAHLENHVHA